MITKHQIFLFATLLPLLTLPAFAQSYTFSLMECNDLTAFPQGMNAPTGAIVGAAHNIDSALTSGFIYADGVCGSTHFGTNGADFFGMTDSNQVIGSIGFQFYLLDKGKSTALPAYPNGYFPYYIGRNSQGVLAGNYYATEIPSNSIGFLYKDGAFNTLPSSSTEIPTLYGLNNNGIGVGTLYSYAIYGFVLQNQAITSFRYPGARFTYFRGINNKNVIVGNYYIQNTGAVGILTYDLNSRTWTDLNFPPEYAVSTPIGISDSGVIALLYSPSGGLLIATPTSN